MKVLKGVFFFAIIIFTYYCLLGYYDDILSQEVYDYSRMFGRDMRDALTDIVIYVIAALHLWLLQRAFIWFRWLSKILYRKALASTR